MISPDISPLNLVREVLDNRPPQLAEDPHILERFVDELHRCGVVGEDRNAKVLFLGLTSRLLDEPVSVALKGLSSSGKSFTTEQTLKFFPADAYLSMTAMSERALVYMKEDFAHRTIVLFEAVALREQREKTESNLTAYFVRSLLSEGRLNYPVTQRDKDGNFVTKTIIKNGPTNLVLTTTATNLHGENETRMISLPTNDSADQTRAILRQLAVGRAAKVDFTRWHDLQRWLAGGEHRVEIPFAGFLADSVPPVAVRLRRDFRAILRLIETHAILHRQNRERDEHGCIVAAEDDYLVVRSLVSDLIAEGVGATVSATIRETVEAVRYLATDEGVTVNAVAAHLRIDKSAASRRLLHTRERGYVVNLEERRGRPARYVVGEPMPDEVDLLPASIPPTDDEGAFTVAPSVAGQGQAFEQGAARTTVPPDRPSMLTVEMTWTMSPAADDDALVDRIVSWAGDDWPAWRMANAAERGRFRHPNGRPYTQEEIWSVVTTP